MLFSITWVPSSQVRLQTQSQHTFHFSTWLSHYIIPKELKNWKGLGEIIARLELEKYTFEKKLFSPKKQMVYFQITGKSDMTFIAKNSNIWNMVILKSIAFNL